MWDAAGAMHSRAPGPTLRGARPVVSDLIKERHELHNFIANSSEMRKKETTRSPNRYIFRLRARRIVVDPGVEAKNVERVGGLDGEARGP